MGSKVTERNEHDDVPIEFACSVCNFTERVEYKGNEPSFSKRVRPREPSYVMKDPFATHGKSRMLVIGTDCSVCERTVCIAKECSVFYERTFCKRCAKHNSKGFPALVRTKVDSM